MDKRNLKRKRRSTDLPVCKYGSSCYQKNSEHLKKYCHPDLPLVETQNSTVDSLTVPPLHPGKRSKQSPVASPTKINLLNSKSKKVNKPLFPEAKFSETVEDILNSMPKDFFDFWDFCSSINKSNPEAVFNDLGFHLVGIYDLLAKKLPNDQKVLLHCHWRYFYDPPEFQTVVKLDGKDLYHIGYFRDDPSEKPSILASNSAALGHKLTLKGDNIFAAMHSELAAVIKKLKAKQKSKFSSILKNLEKFAANKKYTLEVQSTKTKARNKEVVAKTFHTLGIAVPFKNDVGYRPLPDSDTIIKSLLKRIIDTEDLNKKLDVEEGLDELITNVQFANDECDYGMGLELGIDLFCFGDAYFHSHVLHLLPLAYNLLKRPKYGEIIKLHLANRRKSDELNDLNDKSH